MEQTKSNFELFSGKIKITAYDLDPTQGQYILENIHMEALRLEKIFNPYTETSEIFELNKNKKIKPSIELFEMLSKSLELFEKFNKNTSSVAQNSLTADNISISKDLIEILDPMFNLELKNLSKGYIIDKLIHEMKDEAIVSGFIDAKGDLVIYGEMYEIIEIPSSRNTNFEIIGIKLDNSSISTFRNKNHNYFSISVLAKTLLESEFYSKNLFDLDIDKIKLFSDKNSGIKIHILTNSDDEIDFNGFFNMERKIKIRDNIIKTTHAS
ncbi:MAG: hypothetical protein ACE5RF_03490 [Nitrosarchaeum sp.]